MNSQESVGAILSIGDKSTFISKFQRENEETQVRFPLYSQISVKRKTTTLKSQNISLNNSTTNEKMQFIQNSSNSPTTYSSRRLLQATLSNEKTSTPKKTKKVVPIKAESFKGIEKRCLETSQSENDIAANITSHILQGRKYIIRMNDPLRLKFDFLVMIFAAWTCLLTPFEISFVSDDEFEELISVLDTIIDLIFFLDVILNFRTTYVERRTGIEISDPKAIAKNYLFGRFWLDFLASFPFDKVVSVLK